MTSSPSILKIGTRGSPLALWQANEVKRLLVLANPSLVDAIEVVVIKTSGDLIQDRPLSEVGGKGLFTKEIEEALAGGRVDCAVHSMKDVATILPEGLEIPCLLEREDVRDAFLSPFADSIAALPAGAVVGTSSLRRQAQVRAMRRDLQVVNFRGNVETRLRKLSEGVAAATFLAFAGLKRLGREAVATRLMAIDEMLPAVAQGAIGIEIRSADGRTRELLRPLGHEPTRAAVTAERAFLRRLDGSCRTPIAGHVRFSGGEVRFDGEILTPDGATTHRTTRRGTAADAVAMAVDAAEELLGRAGPEFFRTPG